MLDDPRIKRVIKRYRKGEDISDAVMDVSNFGDAELLKACRCIGENAFVKPRELDGWALAYLSPYLQTSFDCSQFDYFLHSYVRPEFADSFADSEITSKPAPEEPHPKIPIEKGMRWRSVRPKDGEEAWEAWEFREDKRSPSSHDENH
jgi:hypothetical protein